VVGLNILQFSGSVEEAFANIVSERVSQRSKRIYKFLGQSSKHIRTNKEAISSEAWLFFSFLGHFKSQPIQPILGLKSTSNFEFNFNSNSNSKLKFKEHDNVK
jgi:hypothetical protein